VYIPGLIRFAIEASTPMKLICLLAILSTLVMSAPAGPVIYRPFSMYIFGFPRLFSVIVSSYSFLIPVAMISRSTSLSVGLYDTPIPPQRLIHSNSTPVADFISFARSKRIRAFSITLSSFFSLDTSIAWSQNLFTHAFFSCRYASII
jgi:hypothetical protein